jgi:hypothetical protein
MRRGRTTECAPYESHTIRGIPVVWKPSEDGVSGSWVDVYGDAHAIESGFDLKRVNNIGNIGEMRRMKENGVEPGTPFTVSRKELLVCCAAMADKRTVSVGRCTAIPGTNDDEVRLSRNEIGVDRRRLLRIPPEIPVELVAILD